MQAVRISAALVAIWVVIGCQKQSSSVPTQAALTTANTNSTTAPTSPAFVEAFLKDVKAGKAKPAALSMAFKKFIAPATKDADKAQGYSDWSAEAWLADLATKVGTEKIKTATANGVQYVTVPGPNATTGRTVLTVVTEGGSPKVNHLHIAPVGSDYDFTSEPTAGFTAVAFLDAVMAGEIKTAEKFLSAATKAKLAPPLDDGDKAQGFNAGMLSVKLDNFKGKATKATIKTLTAKSATGELTSPTPRTFTLTLSATGTIDDFDAK
ncbi:MAG: hypothetical protein ACRC8S_12240 [Fimbriiglobus sp.]